MHSAGPLIPPIPNVPFILVKPQSTASNQHVVTHLLADSGSLHALEFDFDCPGYHCGLLRKRQLRRNRSFQDGGTQPACVSSMTINDGRRLHEGFASGTQCAAQTSLPSGQLGASQRVTILRLCGFFISTCPLTAKSSSGILPATFQICRDYPFSGACWPMPGTLLAAYPVTVSDTRRAAL